MKARHKRLSAILLSLFGVAIAVAFILKAMSANFLFYTKPTDLLNTLNTEENSYDRKYHLGGLVKNGTIDRTENSLDVRFVLTDCKSDIKVTYNKILPDLFAEGQGIIAIGRISQDLIFTAEKVLAKHDENYMPPELEEELRSNYENGEKDCMSMQKSLITE